MTCSKCGYNPDMLTEYMRTVIPKSVIEKRIKELEPFSHEPLLLELAEKSNAYGAARAFAYKELKELLK